MFFFNSVDKSKPTIKKIHNVCDISSVSTAIVKLMATLNCWKREGVLWARGGQSFPLYPENMILGA